jgi:hypothetical protein
MILLACACAPVHSANETSSHTMSQSDNAGSLPALPVPLTLRVGHAEINPASGRTALLAAIEQSNRKARLENLPDHLDPEIIDPRKALALLNGLSRLPRQALRPLAGRILLLNYPDLMIGASAPTRPETFDQPFKIEVADVQGNVVLARSVAKVDCALARERVAEARARLRSAQEEVEGLDSRLATVSGTPDQEHDTLVSLSKARLRRFVLAQVWRQNAQAWTNCPGADNAANDDLAAAAQAVDSYLVPRSTGMP